MDASTLEKAKEIKKHPLHRNPKNSRNFD